MASSVYLPDSVDNLKFNTLLDGLFHASTYVFVALGLATLWRHARRAHVRWSGKLLAGSMLIGFGAFNLVEGIVNHHILGLHHVNETVVMDQWLLWDYGFLAWGAVMLIAGMYLLRSGHRETPEQGAVARPSAAR